MKDKSFVIKVGDLLQSGGKEDTIEFEWRTISELVWLDKQGISGVVVLRSINQDSLYVSLENISCVLDETCDRCWAWYKRIVETPEYISRFVISEERKNEEQETSDEEIFVINARDETIDIQPMLIQAIKLQDPIIKHCPTCEKEIANEPMKMIAMNHL
jgi:uncharacterized metal-binding protein YceD (DUF177 family)